MKQPRKCLVIDDNAEARFLLTKTLLRKFPKCVIQECEDAEVAVAVAGEKDLDLVVVHRLWDTDCVSLIVMIRNANPDVPIIAVSGLDRTKEVLAAGATRFLNYEEWLRIGVVAEEVLEIPSVSVSPFPSARD